MSIPCLKLRLRTRGRLGSERCLACRPVRRAWNKFSYRGLFCYRYTRSNQNMLNISLKSVYATVPSGFSFKISWKVCIDLAIT